MYYPVELRITASIVIELAWTCPDFWTIETRELRTNFQRLAVFCDSFYQHC